MSQEGELDIELIEESTEKFSRLKMQRDERDDDNEEEEDEDDKYPNQDSELDLDDNNHDEDVLITKKLAISKELIKRVTNFDSPFINAILSGNVQILEFLLQQGLSCPLEDFKYSYALAAGYHMEEIAQPMLELLHSAAKACVGDMEQDFPPCQGCREKLREKEIAARTKHKLF